MSDISTREGGGHRPHIHPLEEFADARKPLPLGTDHHSGEEAGDARHKGHHTSGGEEGSHQSEREMEYDERSHHGHSNPDGEEWGNVRGSGHGGCNHGEGEFSCRNHQWHHNPGGESEIGKDPGGGHQEEIGSVTRNKCLQLSRHAGILHLKCRSLWNL